MTGTNDSGWVWLDLEMSGLNPEHHAILEMATVITDSDLRVIAEGPDLAIHQPESVLRDMDEWCTRTHGESGLTDRVRQSTCSLQQAEQLCLAFLRDHIEPGTAILCGNSIWQDRRFLQHHMPDLADFFHYRQLDVSSLKIVFQQWWPELKQPEKKNRHRALEDVYDSIEELRFYRRHLNAVSDT